jgi:hypothetical protein
MKKLYIVLLALALAIVFTVPAMAIHIDDPDSPEGSLGITGRYQLDGQIDDVDGTKSDYFDDDLDLSIVMVQGAVKGFVGLEIADTNPFAGGSHAGKSPITDNYYVVWSAMDNLSVKAGEYGISFARAIGTDGAGARNIQVTYDMDALSITGALIKANDFANATTTEIIAGAEGDSDNDTLYVKVSAKEAGPLTKLDIASFTQMNDVGPEYSYLGVDLALPAGPVGVSFEYGANGGDGEGSFMLLELALEELVGFRLDFNYFASTDDYLSAYDANDFAPMLIFGDQVNVELADVTYMTLVAGYDVDDKLSVAAQVLFSAEDDAGNAYGTEFDAGLKYKLADNVSYALGYGSYSEGDFGVGEDVDRTETWHRLEFKF